MPLRIPLALLALLAVASPARSEIYSWTDEQGVTRFTDRIEDVPAEHRHDVAPELRGEGAEAAPERVERILAVEQPPAAPEPPATPPELGDLAGRLLGFGVLAVVAFGVVALGVSFALMAFVIRLACRLVGEEVPGFGRAFAVAVLQMVAGVALGVVLAGVVLAGGMDASAPAFQGLQLLLGFGVNAAVVRFVLGVGWGSALAVALLAIVLVAVLGIAVFLVVGLGVAALAGSAG